MNPLSALLNLFLPRECHVCGSRLLESEKFVCGDCVGELPYTGYDNYWNNDSGINTDLNPMEQRFAGHVLLGHACAPFFYSRDSALASLIQDFKYRNFPSLAVTLGRIGASRLSVSMLFDGVDLLLPVPLHRTKRRRRGYNQSEKIAEGVSEVTGIPLGDQLVARKAHRTQTSLSAERRFENTLNVFGVERPETLRGKHIMLVDDICTTGATLLAAARAVTENVGRETKISFFTVGVV